MKVITIGRDIENNNIVVNDHKVSRNHLQMVLDDNGNYSVLDLNSTNGTFVNGQRITGEVPLKVTDELRIGDTVLPWQSYFNDQVSPEAKSSVTPQTSVSHPSVPKKQQKLNSGSKPWLIYVIVGAIVLLLAGGGVGWKIYRDRQLKEAGHDEMIVGDIDAIDRQNALNEAEKEAAEKTAAYEEKMRKAAEAQAEAERLEKIAAQSNSEKDRKAAEKAKHEAESMQQDAKKAKKLLDEAEKQVSTLRAQIKKLEEDYNQATIDKKKLEEEKARTEESLTLTNKMQECLNGWDENKAFAFCKEQGWKCGNKKDAKNVITKQFSQLDNTVKKQKINEMKHYKVKAKEKDKESTGQTGHKQPAETQPASSGDGVDAPPAVSTPSETKTNNSGQTQAKQK